MPTVHNPSNFNPQDYEVIDYFDNKPPEAEFGGVDPYAMAQWSRELKELFPDGNAFRCDHCGNTNVRYVVSCLHIPSGKHICFGSDCVAKLDFKNRDDLKAHQMRARAELRHARVKVYQQYLQWVAANPDAGDLVARAQAEVHARNRFVQDVVGKLKQYGSISEKQKTCVLRSMQQDIDRANAPAEIKGDAPSGRVEVVGEIVCTKVKEGDFGSTLKMLVKLANNATVWCTVPDSLHNQVDQAVIAIHGEGAMSIPLRGCKISVKANWTVKEGEKSFAFGKRPHAKLLELPVAVTAPPTTTQTNNAQAAKVITDTIAAMPEAYREVAASVAFKGIESGKSLVEMAMEIEQRGQDVAREVAEIAKEGARS